MTSANDPEHAPTDVVSADYPPTACFPPADDGTHTIAATPSKLAAADDSAPMTNPGAPPGYEIERELGRGGMGVVYLAKQLSLSRPVALKMILAGAHAGSREFLRFDAEAEAIAQIDHPNIVRVHEVGRHDGLPYFTLEYCAGGGMDKKLGGNPLAPTAAAGLAETLARAVHSAHCKGIVHRDLKPANVLLAADGTPKVTDFGLAKRSGSDNLTATGAVMGTPSYMAPEQAAGKGKEVGPTTDVYALGAMFYEFLTGRPPFRAATALDTVLQVVRDDPVPPSRLTPSTPRDLETICLKCLHKDPARRYPTAEAVADDLGRWLKNEPIAARPVGPIERVMKWARRRPALSGTLAVSALAAAMLVAGGVWFTAKLRWERDHALNQEGIARSATAAEQLRARELADALTDVRKERDEKEKARRAEAALKEEAIENEKASRAVVSTVLALMQENAARAGGRSIDIPSLLAAARNQIEVIPAQERRARMELLAMVGGLHAAFGREREAVPFFEVGLALHHQFFGENRRETLAAKSVLAETYLLSGEPVKGLEMLQDMVRRADELLGPTDPMAVQSKRVLAHVYNRAGQFDKALALCDVAVAEIRKVDGPDAAGAITFFETAASACAGLKRHDREESYLREAIRVETATRGRVHLDTSVSMARLALRLMAREKWDAAEVVLRDLLGIREELARRDPKFPRWLVPNTKSLLGGALLGRKKYAEAGPLLVTGVEELLKEKDAVPPNGWWNLNDGIDRVVRYYTENGETGKAEEWRVRRVAPLEQSGPIPPAAP